MSHIGARKQSTSYLADKTAIPADQIFQIWFHQGRKEPPCNRLRALAVQPSPDLSDRLQVAAFGCAASTGVGNLLGPVARWVRRVAPGCAAGRA